jgi:hypothetical protein
VEILLETEVFLMASRHGVLFISLLLHFSVSFKGLKKLLSSCWLVEQLDSYIFGDIKHELSGCGVHPE